MKKALLFLLTVCFIFASFAFCVSAEEYEEYEGQLCFKNELDVASTQFVDHEDYVGEGPFDFFGVSIVAFEFLWKGTFENQEYEYYWIKVAPDVDTVEARKQLMQNECFIDVSYVGVEWPDDDETETPVSKTVEFTESIYECEYYNEQEMSELGLEESFCGKEATPIIIDSRDMIDALSNCYEYGAKTDFDEYFAKYDEAFFEDNALVVVLTCSPDHGYTYEILSLEYAEDGETLVFGFKCVHYFNDVTDECMYLLVMAEVKKEDIADCTSITTEYSYIDAIKGDVTFDGTVDSLDYLMVKRAAFGTFELSKAQFMCADVHENSSYVIDSADYLLIKRIAFGTYVE